MEFILYPAMFIGSFALAIGIAYLLHQDRAAKTRTWEGLARVKNLSFTPGRWILFKPQEASVHGQYHGCALTLTIVHKGQGKSTVTYTQLSVSGPGDTMVPFPKDRFPLGHPLTADEVEKLLSSQPTYYQGNKPRLEVYNRGRTFIYEEVGIITDTSWLETLFELLTTITTSYPRILALGGDVVPALEKLADDNAEILRIVARQLLQDIEEDTRHRLERSDNRLICPTCLTGCVSYDLSLGWWTSCTFYGCRTCRQSREFLQAPLVAVLDNQMEAVMAHQQRGVRVNWLRHRELFDFDQVKIVHATDEDVERFAVQVGNDTDEWRKPRYSKMACTVSAQCHLSENTLRILERMFGEVIVEV